MARNTAFLASPAAKWEHFVVRRAVRAIIIRDGNLLVMHRNKFGKQYYTLPGGNIEMGETPEQAVFRELHEETMVTVANPILKFVEEAGDPYGTQYVFHCEYISGDPRLHEPAGRRPRRRPRARRHRRLPARGALTLPVRTIVTVSLSR